MSLRPCWIACVLAVASATRAADTPGSPPGFEVERDYSFAEVVRTSTGQEIIPFDNADSAHRQLLVRLRVAALLAARQARETGIEAARANEAGNAIEAVVLRALAETGLQAGRPRTTGGRAQAAGYPDVAIDSDPPCYLELKTYSERTADSTQRTFYFSPSAETKVVRPAIHLLLAYQLVPEKRGDTMVWVPVRFRLVSLHNLKVRLKVEYNQSNRGLYAPENMLAEGDVK